VYSFFVTYASQAGWEPSQAAPPVAERAPLDRWILSRVARLANEVEIDLRDYDALDATRAIDGFIEELSTWYLRRSRKRFGRGADATDRASAFATMHATLVALTRISAPILPFLSEAIYQNLVVAGGVVGAPDSVHLTGWPSPRRSWTSCGRCEARLASRLASPWPGCGSRCQVQTDWSTRTPCSTSSRTR
jgi:isoleucyl-tRNA synthetase